jgi:phosphatidylinositol-3-phosphatase
VVAPSGDRALYPFKHNGFMNFQAVQDDPNRANKIVGLPQLLTDLKTDKVPNYSHIVPNQCNEIHGLPECLGLQDLIKTGDAVVNQLMVVNLQIN